MKNLSPHVLSYGIAGWGGWPISPKGWRNLPMSWRRAGGMADIVPTRTLEPIGASVGALGTAACARAEEFFLGSPLTRTVGRAYTALFGWD